MLEHPPLACRPSPPQGGRLAFINVCHQSHTLKNEYRGFCQPISTLVGEMAGRPEGGVEVRTRKNTPQIQ
ncbi:hypothetical protein C5748_00850 [Phyllobacterium phragmitis]|uniref:Uncharacterized protein n=1 Tax=Phyllobacterium phragmitis TaxID=2670329 RepID=A0A2S9IYY5_9HYPH|nr:hypothetical protein C5748_00850 [Phyllobacterium phragmitis]